MKLLVWLLRRWHRCGHLGPAVRLCYCDPFRRQHWRELPNPVFYECRCPHDRINGVLIRNEDVPEIGCPLHGDGDEVVPGA